MTAALVLCAVVAWQTWRLERLTPEGTATSAVVIAREMRRPFEGAALAESVVVLEVANPAGGRFAAVTPHPPATLTEIWVGATVEVAVIGTPPQVAYQPMVPARQRRITIVALLVALGLAIVLGLIGRVFARVR
jgi:hypothetical protein